MIRRPSARACAFAIVSVTISACRTAPRPAVQPVAESGAIAAEAGQAARPVRNGGAAAAVAALGTIAGAVFDSLDNRPLPAAHVHVRRLARDVVADSAGHFRIDAVPVGAQLVWADHPTLDSLGLFILGATVSVKPGGDTQVLLAIPSFASIWRTFCAGPVPNAAAGQGLIFGRVRSALGDAVDSTTVVEATWLADGGRHMAGTASLDDQGSYAACGVPRDRALTIRAKSGMESSLPFVTRLRDRPMARRNLTLGSVLEVALEATSAMMLDTLAAPGDARTTLVGTVRDTAGHGIRDARVRVTGMPGEGRTDETGRYVVHGAPAGLRLLTVSAIGYLPSRAMADVYANDSVRFDAVLGRATVLSEVKVTGRAMFDERVRYLDQRRRVGWGYFVDSLTVERSILVRHTIDAPGVHIAVSNVGAWYAFTTRPNLFDGTPNPDFTRMSGCVMPMYIDGRLAEWEEVDAMKGLHAIAWIEVHPSFSGIPEDLLPSMLNARNACGAILVWTKSYLHPSK
jgi:hypothetical protein